MNPHLQAFREQYGFYKKKNEKLKQLDEKRKKQNKKPLHEKEIKENEVRMDKMGWELILLEET